MSRVLLAWELGDNLGHLSKLLPLATRLKERGHEVLVVVRNVALATEVLAPAGIRFVQSPIDLRVRANALRPRSYADILLMEGWDRPPTLWGLVQSWGNLLALFRPDIVVLDYAPTLLLAARILRVRAALIGTGFELPPLEVPLPAFPGFGEVTTEEVKAADAHALASANHVLEAYRAAPLASLCDLFRTEGRWLTTFAELDQYGARSGEMYVGPINWLDRGEPVQWPPGFKHRILAYVRPGMANLPRILRALASERDSAVICAAPGVSTELEGGIARPGFQFIPRPVEFEALLPQTSAFVSYAPAASMTRTLLAAIPQIMCPLHVEAQMTAVRVVSMGAGLTLRGDETEQEISMTLRRVLSEHRLKSSALEFANRHHAFDPLAACERIVTEIERLSGGFGAREPAKP